MNHTLEKYFSLIFDLINFWLTKFKISAFSYFFCPYFIRMFFFVFFLSLRDKGIILLIVLFELGKRKNKSLSKI